MMLPDIPVKNEFFNNPLADQAVNRLPAPSFQLLMRSNHNRFQAKTNFSEAKVLFIEDNDDQWLLIKHTMKACLPEIAPVRVATASQALELLEEWRHQEWELPQLILLDLYLPDSEDGWQVLKRIKAMPAPIKLIPIVILSCSDSANDITRSYQLGASSYLVKPVSPGQWLVRFRELRTYWLETVTLPPKHYTF
jgi:CheY-like chemotaxis protein